MNVPFILLMALSRLWHVADLHLSISLYACMYACRNVNDGSTGRCEATITLLLISPKPRALKLVNVALGMG